MNRPSCDATNARASRWSCTNCAAERWRVPPSSVAESRSGTSPLTGSVTISCSTVRDPSRRRMVAPNASSSKRCERTAAPSTAVSPAMASTSTRTSSRTLSSARRASRSASPRNGGTMG